jgi:hypothetical protein
MRLGADGLLSGEGLHRIAMAPATAAYTSNVESAPPPPAEVVLAPQADEAEAEVEQQAEPEEPAEQPSPAAAADDAYGLAEPVLTADELRALLQEQPPPPSSVGNGNEA